MKINLFAKKNTTIATPPVMKVVPKSAIIEGMLKNRATPPQTQLIELTMQVTREKARK